MSDILFQVGIPAAVTLVLGVIGIVASVKLGVGTSQKALVETLQGEVNAYEAKVARLEGEFVACKARLEYVERSNADLKEEVFQLRTAIQKSLSRPKTRRTRADD